MLSFEKQWHYCWSWDWVWEFHRNENLSCKKSVLMKNHFRYKAENFLFLIIHDILEQFLQSYLSQWLQHFKHTFLTSLLDLKWSFQNFIDSQVAARHITHHQKKEYVINYNTVSCVSRRWWRYKSRWVILCSSFRECILLDTCRKCFRMWEKFQW